MSRSVAMTLTRHKTPNIRRRDANVAEHALRAAGLKLAHRLQDVNRSVTIAGTTHLQRDGGAR